jgi:hypothetical protein
MYRVEVYNSLCCTMYFFTVHWRTHCRSFRSYKRPYSTYYIRPSLECRWQSRVCGKRSPRRPVYSTIHDITRLEEECIHVLNGETSGCHSIFPHQNISLWIECTRVTTVRSLRGPTRKSDGPRTIFIRIRPLPSKSECSWEMPLLL